MSSIVITSAGRDGPVLCEPILRSVPQWFGIEAATLKYIADTGRMPTWIARAGDRAVGFVMVAQHYPVAAEVHCIAVHKERHGTGVGTELLRHVERELRASGVEYLQVKTMGPSKPNAEYARTTHFYESRGFVRLEEVTGLWPGLPTLILVKRL